MSNSAVIMTKTNHNKNVWLVGKYIAVSLLLINLITGDVMSKNLSFIEKLSQKFTVNEERTQGKNLHPSNPEFHKPEADKTLFRSWQKNPEVGATCFTIDHYFGIDKILCEPKWRVFFQSYRTFNIFLSFDDACKTRDELLKWLEKRQYELYGISKQCEFQFDKN